MFETGLWRFGGFVDPSRDVRRLRQEMDRIFSDFAQPVSREFPAVNAWIGEADAVVTAELPGIDPSAVEVSVVGDTLTISGSREATPLMEGESYHRQERGVGGFSRSLQLPFHVDADKVEAKYEKGIIGITLPRSEAEKPRKILVKNQ
ncbi:MAG: Hsp20/alpha crystallin family protein [Syntrophobacterales bacterium]|nr:Hsp20/alpha crystallin family protein [Syntrophobacterales bacterium]